MSPLRITSILGGLVFAGSLIVLSGCGDKASTGSFDADSKKHVDGWLFTGHKSAAAANVEACAECHGSDFSGGISKVSCTQCHMGGVESVHPAEWGKFVYSRHAAYVTQNGTAACATAICHGADLTGVKDSGPSCTSCHIGGLNSFHPAGWKTQPNLHIFYVQANGTASCANAACHGPLGVGVPESGPACASCHKQQMIF